VTVNDDNSREAVDLDPRVQVETLKERLDPLAAIQERVAEGEKRGKGGKR